MQAITATTTEERQRTGQTHAALATDLYALVVFLHKNCNSDLFEAVGALELTLTQIKLLHHLEDAVDEITLKRAGELVHVSLPAASRMVDDLVRRGFVERHEDADDRRMKRVSLTEAGRAVIRKLNAARLSGLVEFIDSLTDSERRAVAGALSKLLQREDVADCRPEGLEL
jgi:DNA-binding MarR family transcriptional regulator